MQINYHTQNASHVAVREAYKLMISKMMFIHKSAWLEEFMEGHTNRDIKVMMYHAAVHYAIILRNEVKYNGLTIEEAKTKYDYSGFIKKLWKHDINVDSIITDIFTVSFDSVSNLDNEFLLYSSELIKSQKWTVLSNPYTLTTDSVSYTRY